MLELEVSQGTTTAYLGMKIRTTFYSVIHNNRLIIRTSNKHIALDCAKQLQARSDPRKNL